MYDLSNYKELTLIVFYDRFKHWRDSFPDLNKIPDNELSYIIFEGMLKPYNLDCSTVASLTNAIQFTNVPDMSIYKTSKKEVMAWLLKGVELYREDLGEYYRLFSEIKHIVVSTNKTHNYIVVNICGAKAKIRKENDSQSNLIGIPSTNGIFKCEFSSDYNKRIK